MIRRNRWPRFAVITPDFLDMASKVGRCPLVRQPEPASVGIPTPVYGKVERATSVIRAAI